MSSPARIGILGGTGREGRGLAARLAAHGVPVVIGSRSLEQAREAVIRIARGAATPAGAAANDGGTRARAASGAARPTRAVKGEAAGPGVATKRVDGKPPEATNGATPFAPARGGRAAHLDTATKDAAALLDAATIDEVVDRCDIVVLSVPFRVAAEVLERYRDRWRPGTVVVDVTVPLVFGPPLRVEMPPEGSAAEHLRERLHPRVGLVSTFKTIPASVLAATDVPLDCDEFVCSDAPDSKVRVMEAFAPLSGLRLIDVGGLYAARALERMTLLAIKINRHYHVRSARFRVVGI